MRNRPVPNRRTGLPPGAVLTSLLALTLFALPRVDAADRLTLPNGEVLLGSLVAETDDAYLFHSDTFGDLKVLKVTQPLLERDSRHRRAQDIARLGAATPARCDSAVAKAELRPRRRRKRELGRSLEAEFLQARGEIFRPEHIPARRDHPQKRRQFHPALTANTSLANRNDENNDHA
jgi:hypothetical protein